MMKLRTIFNSLVCMLISGFLSASHAQISQTPLLTQAGSVHPNLVLMFDDSGSMDRQYIYQYLGREDGYGRGGPGVSGKAADCSGSFSISATCTYNAPPSSRYYELSPDVNLLTYDPRIRYRTRISSTGTLSVSGTPDTTTFHVYFYKNGSGFNQTWLGTDTPTSIVSYFSPTFVAGTSLLASNADANRSYPTAIATGTGPFPKFLNRTDCASTNCTLSEERQNYANWKKYHSNRLDLAKTGLGYAFQDVTATLRLGWNTINRSTLVSGVGLYNQTRKDAFYTWLYSQNAPNGTPNLAAVNRIGRYFSRADNKGPWADTPDTTSTGLSTLATTATDTDAIRAAHLSCRRSYAMLVTDGYYTDTIKGVTSDDSTNAALITGTTSTGGTFTFSYTASASESKLYSQTQANTLADIAMKYWITDLRTDVPNRVKPIPASVTSGVTTTFANESFWQNMSFYAVGLGVFGTLPQTNATRNSIAAGTMYWPQIVDGEQTTIDDMWHATINGRGRQLSAKNADALSDAVEGMLAEINKSTSSQSGVAASTLSLNTGTRKYTPNYTTGSWIGNVVSTQLDPSSGAELSVTWQVVGTNAATGISYNGIPNHTSRSIYAWDGSAFGTFNATNTYVNGSVVGATTNLINYLRGDQTNEDPNGTSQYRAREVLLGDIVNSSPVYIKGGLNASYNLLPSGTYGQSTYATFVANKAARAEGVLFAGANDGMLHGFRDTTGAEVFAFVPRAVMPKLHQLASRSYDHQYYVDGPNVEADACLTGGSACTVWSNLLVGTAGAGAKTVYALDVTNPTAMTATSIKWEITTATTGYANLGHVLTDVQTGLTMSGDWVAIFGNGAYGADGVARLYITNLNTGALIREISTGVGSGNGLGGVRLVRDSNQRIIGAYAGDLKGNLWKFDLSSTLSTNWALGLSNSPLYNATSTKPITAPPNVVAHPNGGRVVVFGTGKLFDATDVTSTTTQSLYGVWDSVAFGSATTPLNVTQTGVASLVQQTISLAITGTQVITSANLSTATQTISYFAVSRNTIDWASKRGWYINLPNTGQRITYPIESLAGQFVLIDSLSPSNVSTDPCVQSGSGRAWNYIIDGVTGSGPASAIFDTNGDGVINTYDSILSGYENTADGRTRVIRNDARSTTTSTYFTPLSTQQQPGFSISCALTNTCVSTGPTPGNPSIRSVVKRNWRQLFPR
ncbi:MAG: PilC/PilY family type IV pilus protein [Polaromonas sp.]